MKHLPSSKTIPNWQVERALILNRICQRILARKTSGQSLNRAIIIFSRRWSGRPFRCDPSRKFQLKASTLFQKYRAWRLQGMTTEAFKLNYCPCNRRIPTAVIIRFINFAAIKEFKSCKAAWREFCQRRGTAGPGKVKLGYDALMWNLPRGYWHKVKAARKTKHHAEQAINLARLAAIDEIQLNVSAKLPRRRGDNFEI